jgi:hypothetical protein
MQNNVLEHHTFHHRCLIQRYEKIKTFAGTPTTTATETKKEAVFQNKHN